LTRDPLLAGLRKNSFLHELNPSGGRSIQHGSDASWPLNQWFRTISQNLLRILRPMPGTDQTFSGIIPMPEMQRPTSMIAAVIV
jgi:hypothetical protein